MLPLALDSVSCMRKRYPFVSAPAIERDRSSDLVRCIIYCPKTIIEVHISMVEQ